MKRTDNSSISSKSVSPKIMGIVNVTPDSFSDGGAFFDVDNAISYARTLIAQGADIIDIGGESTRPGADAVSTKEELRRILPVIEGLAEDSKCPISIDTRKPHVAKLAFDAGATIWNDVSGLTFADDSLSSAAQLGCEVVVMHAQGLPATMQDNPTYHDVVEEVSAWLLERTEICLASGIKKTNIILDPGIGFGKTTHHNLALMAHFEQLKTLGFPLLFGASRKRFIGDLDNGNNNRLGGSIAAALLAAQKGADILRVHDVAQTKQAIKIMKAIEEAQ